MKTKISTKKRQRIWNELLASTLRKRRKRRAYNPSKGYIDKRSREIQGLSREGDGE